MRKFFDLYHRIPLAWTAFAIGVLLFVFTRLIPGTDWQLPAFSQERLDQAYINVLQEDLVPYSVLGETHKQTFGAHVLSQYLRATLSLVTGDSVRAGVWLSLVGVIASLAGVYSLSKRILPLRGFCTITMVAMAGVGSLHYAVKPDPSTALGMALVLWGVSLFTSALERELPIRSLYAAVLFGLAGYIRFELSLLQVPLSLYLLMLIAFPSRPHKRGMPLGAMAFGALFVVALMLWPLINVNMGVSKSPILPGPDASIILGALRSQSPAGLPVFERIVFGFKTLLFDPVGLGVFAGLLWPLGMIISLLTNREKSIPVFWLPVVVISFFLLTAMSFVTGLKSYQECLQILAPMLLPFSVLPVIFVVFRWFQERPRGFMESRKIWVLAAMGVYLMFQVPHAFRKALNLHTSDEDIAIELVEGFKRQNEAVIQSSVLTDMPGVLLLAGKTDVYGLGGETDWKVLFSKYSDGSLNPEELLEYMSDRKIGVLHFSDISQEQVVAKMQQVLGSGTDSDITVTSIVRIPQFNSPHLVYRIQHSPSAGL